MARIVVHNLVLMPELLASFQPPEKIASPLSTVGMIYCLSMNP